MVTSLLTDIIKELKSCLKGTNIEMAMELYSSFYGMLAQWNVFVFYGLKKFLVISTA